ncbi:hypothetical protein M9458_016427, partial [Cirrhinus mrigala]
GENGPFHQCTADFNCLPASAGQQSPRNISGRSHYRQLPDVHHDPGHLFCHPQCCGTQPSPSLPQHTPNAPLGAQ